MMVHMLMNGYHASVHQMLTLHYQQASQALSIMPQVADEWKALVGGETLSSKFQDGHMSTQ